MRQVLQHLRTGQIELAELPTPGVRPGEALIRSRASLISAGTERMLVEFSQAGLIQKARQQPDKVRQVLDKIRTDGLVPTLEAVFVEKPLALDDGPLCMAMTINAPRRRSKCFSTAACYGKRNSA